MWSALRARTLPLRSSSSNPSVPPPWKLGFLGFFDRTLCSTPHDEHGSSSDNNNNEDDIDSKFLTLQEIEKVLSDVKAEDVKVIPVSGICSWTDYMVIATGRSSWHVKNIAQSLIYQTKEKQKGSKCLMLPSVQGRAAGKWVVLDSGRIVIHAFDEEARDYYGLERLYTEERCQNMRPDENVRRTFRSLRRGPRPRPFFYQTQNRPMA